MKKAFTILTLSAIALLGCEDKQIIDEATNKNVRFAGLRGEVRIVTDNETGCKYIREEYGSGSSLSISLSPLIKASGVIDCD